MSRDAADYKALLELFTHYGYWSPKALSSIVRADGTALEYIVDQTEDLCLEAVTQNGMALEHVRNQTE